MRLIMVSAGMGMALVCASADSAESQTPPSWTVEDPVVRPATTVAELLVRLDRQDSFTAPDDGVFDPMIESGTAYSAVSGSRSPWTTARQDVWFDGDGFTDRLSLKTEAALRRLDGTPIPLNPAALEVEAYDVSYIRGWPATLGYTASGLEVTLTPHAGVGVGSHGGSAEAGATLKIGADINRLLPDGSVAFGERARWYLYAAGSGRAVGYNFARTRDGDFARSGVSHDAGSFMGDASLGVAFRKGDLQSSFGLVYRELGPSDVRFGPGIDNDVSEGLVAFQLSIKPEW